MYKLALVQAYRYITVRYLHLVVEYFGFGIDCTLDEMLVEHVQNVFADILQFVLDLNVHNIRYKMIMDGKLSTYTLERR